MKFVKGDVIASLVILVVNFLGGLAIGVGMKGMPAVDALKRYGLLTIGDGLVTQIPALVLSTAAGVLVTRVAQRGGRHAARRGARAAAPRRARGRCRSAGVFVAAARARCRACPRAPFLVIGVALLLVGRARARAKSVEEQRAATEPTPTERARAGSPRSRRSCRSSSRGASR